MKSPIGIFDSGVGGTSIWREIIQLLPKEDTLYLADSDNAPYGSKTSEEILELSIKNTELLMARGCKIIVVACNTATTNAIDELRRRYSVPFIGIEPAIKPAALKTVTKKVGVLATKGTLASSLFHNTSKMYASGITILEQEGKGLVSLVEQGKAQSDETQNLLQEYITPMLMEDIDCLVLGCTHYPYLIPTIKKFAPQTLQIIDSGFAVAKQTKAILNKHGLLNSNENENPEYLFYTNGNPLVLQSLVANPKSKISFLSF